MSATATTASATYRPREAARSALPADLKKLSKEYLLAMIQASSVPAAMLPAIQRAVAAIGGSFAASDAGKLFAASRAAHLQHPAAVELRLVDRKILFTEADLYYDWSGTLVEIRPGAGFTADDPTAHFLIYVPGRSLRFSSNFEVTVRQMKQRG